jgi:hypothetical protein
LLELLQASVGADHRDGLRRVVYVAKVEALNLATGLQEDLYFASTTFNTDSGDTPASTTMLGGFTSPNIEANIFDGRNFSRLTTGRGGRRSIGQITIANPTLDVARDPHVRSGTWDGTVKGDQAGLLTGPYDFTMRTVTGYIGPEDGGFAADFESYFTATIEATENTSNAIIWRINPAGQDWSLPVQDNLYGSSYTVTEFIFVAPASDLAGPGPLDIPPIDNEIFGTPRPICLGRLIVRPQILNFANSVYQFHSEDGQATNAINEVYEGAYSSTAGGPVYTGDTTNNTITLNATPDKPITAEIEGAKPGGSYIDRPGEIIEEILTQHMGYASGDLVSGTVAAYDAEFNYAVGIYIDGELDKSRSQAVSELLEPLGFLVFERQTGKMKLGWVEEPYDSTADPSIAFDESDIKDLSFTMLSPAWRILVGYRPMDRPLGHGDILAAAGDAAKNRHAQPYRWVEKVDLGVKKHFKDAVELRFKTRFWTRAAAEVMAGKCMTTFRQQRRYTDMTVTNKVFQYDLGDVVSIGWPRYGFISDGDWEFEDGEPIQFDDDANVTKENPAVGLPGLVVGFVDNPGSGEFRVRCWV